MTIAACYVSSEGVVLGADSTASYGLAGGPHYYNHAQKLFELGEGSTLGALTWGLGGLPGTSHRTMFAELADDLAANPPTDLADVMNRWIARYWAQQAATVAGDPFLKAEFDRCIALGAKPPFDPQLANPDARTADEESEFQDLRQRWTSGFCIGGRVGLNRAPSAQFVHFDPAATAAPTPVQIGINGWQFWGAPNMIQRLLFAADGATRASILGSGKWSGTSAELDAVLANHHLAHPWIPLRDAVDFVHACIYSTIKALKFSHFSQICGGPIEIAVISTDRKFRWVHHKSWETAIADGAPP